MHTFIRPGGWCERPLRSIQTAGDLAEQHEDQAQAALAFPGCVINNLT
jgi:hypothetical protein